MMQYKGYSARVEYDAEAKILHGEVEGIRDVVTFQGKSVVEIEKAFHESIDDYMEFCAGRGESPDKPMSGRFLLRIDPALHRQIQAKAAAEGKSLNAWVVDAVRGGVSVKRSAGGVKRSNARRASRSGRR